MVKAREVRCLMKAAATSARHEAPARRAGPAEHGQGKWAARSKQAAARRDIRFSQALFFFYYSGGGRDTGSPRRVNVS